MLFQMYREALWLYLETFNGRSFEDYFDSLLDNLQKGLSQIGFVQSLETIVRDMWECNINCVSKKCVRFLAHTVFLFGRM